MIGDRQMTNENRSCIAIGNFDGVHKGHDILIKTMLDISHQNSLKSIILTFKYSDNTMKKSVANTKYITTLDNKLSMLKSYNADDVFMIDLNTHVSKYSPEKFIEEILVNQYKMKHVVIGYNFNFGYKAQGNVETLKKYADVYDYDVTVIEHVKFNNIEISSSVIRKYILDGQIKMANNLLTNKYTIYANDVKFTNESNSIVCENRDIIIPLDGQYNVMIGDKKYKATITTIDNKKIINFNESINEHKNIIFFE